jgi:hypothetical protein
VCQQAWARCLGMRDGMHLGQRVCDGVYHSQKGIQGRVLCSCPHLCVCNGSTSGCGFTQSPRRDRLESFPEARQERDRAVRGRGLVGALARLGYHHTVSVFPFRGVDGRCEEVREYPGEGVREASVKATHGFVTYLVRADRRPVIQACNDVVDFGARYRVEFIAEVSLARDEVRGENFGGIVSRWEKRIPEGVAFLLEILGSINRGDGATVGLVLCKKC